MSRCVFSIVSTIIVSLGILLNFITGCVGISETVPNTKFIVSLAISGSMIVFGIVFSIVSLYLSSKNRITTPMEICLYSNDDLMCEGLKISGIIAICGVFAGLIAFVINIANLQWGQQALGLLLVATHVAGGTSVAWFYFPFGYIKSVTPANYSDLERQADMEL